MQTQIANRLGEIDVVENVSRGNAERQIVTIVACAAIRAAVAAKTAATHASVAMTSRNAPESSGRSGATASCVRGFLFLPEAEGFAQPKIQGKQSRPYCIIEMNHRCARLRGQIETAVGSLFYTDNIRSTRAKRRRSEERRVGKEGGAGWTALHEK